MIIRPPTSSDWELFSTLADSESWRVPWTELQLFKGPWSQYAHVLDDDGFCGLVTSVAYEKSAWIGNLIIPIALRRKGYGTHLFKSALANLIEQGKTTVWLTASEQGRSLYEREGFVAVDVIERWVLSPSREAAEAPVVVDQPCEQLLYADQLVWGERRELLFSALCNNGKIFAVENTVAMLQSGPDIQVAGPWYCNDSSLDANSDLLSMMIAAAEPSVDFVVDLFGSSPIRSLCKSAGFKCTGQAALMAYGSAGIVNLNSIVSLASLGSIG